ncbi:MAG: GH92 family glycosyl hydrolase [Betaproteobacteria bacterium]
MCGALRLLARRALALALATGAAAAGAAGGTGDRDPARWVNPFIGTDGTGHVTPAAAVPFGMVMPGPDHADRGWSFASGYQWRAPQVLGFSNTHISGAGIPELGDVLLMPVQGEPWGAETASFAAAPDKTREAASPGHYTVRLPAHGVTVELTATPKVALHRYTFDRGGRVQVLVDLQHGLHFVEGPRVTRAEAQVDAARGEVHGTGWSRNWVKREASVVLRFDRPAARVQAVAPRPGELAPRWLLSFDLGTARVLHARVALSTVDVAGARANLATADGLGFDAARRQARRDWNALLGRLQLDAPPREKRILYSALYRSLVHPSDIADADGRVRGPAGRVIAAPGGRYYSTLSLWDTFRGVHPLLTLVAPERVGGIVQTMLAHHAEMGYLPLWTAWGRETHTMIGNPALPVIAEAVAKGLHRQGRGFDAAAALRAMVETSTRERPGAPPWAQRGWAVLDQHGYLPFDRVPGEAVSITLELGIGDDAVARVARALGDEATAARFAQRAAGWRHLWDAQSQQMRGKDSQGRWREPFDPLVPTSPMNNPGDYTEANAWQYTPTPALHDVAGFIQVLGGEAALEAWLDRFFATPSLGTNKHLGQEALIGQYAHGNEPSHHIAWLYAFTARPDKGHALVRRIAREFYGDGPDGLIGNDDCGQMGAWRVLAALGLYPVMPASGQWVLAPPLVRQARLVVPGQPVLVLQGGAAVPAGAVPRLDGRALSPRGTPHAELLRGGVLRWR